MSEIEKDQEPSGFDIFLSYADVDDGLARALQGELQRARPGLRVWSEKSRLGLGDALSQEIDEVLSNSRLVIVVWTPERLMSRAAMDEVERALTLQKPALNVLVDLEKPNLPAPYSLVRSYSLDAVPRLAGRSGGWLPPSRPDHDEVRTELRPILEALDDTPPVPSRDMAEQLISDLIEAAGEPGTPQFDALMSAVARSDRASAVEVMLNSGYTPEKINQLMSPKRLEMADITGSRPNWGAWRIEPAPARAAQAADEPWPWAVGGFVLASLLGLGAWLMSSVLATPQTAAPAGTVIQASLPTCSVADDGSISGGECRLTVDVPPRQAATIPPPVDEPTLATCQIRADGGVGGVPCRLDQVITPPPPAQREAAADQPATLTACSVTPDGRILGAPCRLEAAYTPPATARIPACTRMDNGAITNVPCRIAVPMPPLENFTQPEPVQPETVAEPLPACPPIRPGQTIRGECRLLRPIVVAHARCDSDLGNVPCSLMETPQIAAATVPTPVPAPEPSTPPPSTPAPQPIRAEPTPPPAPVLDLPPIPVPDNLEPCEVRKLAPCRLTIAKTGLGSLSEIAESYYGSVRAYCRIFRANPNVFGTRSDPRTPSNPNCIYLEDVLDLPAFPDDMQFPTDGCPAPQQQNVCVRP